MLQEENFNIFGNMCRVKYGFEPEYRVFYIILVFSSQGVSVDPGAASEGSGPPATPDQVRFLYFIFIFMYMYIVCRIKDYFCSDIYSVEQNSL